jgi:hypothetical protein
VASLLDLLTTKEGDKPAVKDWKNDSLKASSFVVSQRDMLDLVHKALSDSDREWSIMFEPRRSASTKCCRKLQG